ncbi:diguanylate cyclase/phosphodiesterase (GGDEF & EAL domains) with PAS/PAC sensor(s) [Thioalkalivibrio nitratireducens DSM 14787]|uniref:cyclic-guanylate-specific phosphodiesterase n=1 Tax=Thioalkalivibrio nitratireducens (strain DSM 14787 / UNIQEM 213 / ALEN2) TaxID=1255043 RepID=L0DX95_THIND|nr:bifunctional diguanylate cyclase/phosphodiesterase [Thioalkalivibrio nitratireducens]AGA33668.1 diguanylate cyclase/phosphodiesterase (GGDEF & EAL domains) with PAS/PAC sensor(s) [Thioalkalivibrio nitratireducens DSM 14787]
MAREAWFKRTVTGSAGGAIAPSAAAAMAAGAVVALFGLAVMLAWHAGYPGLLPWQADLVPVHYNTALALFLVGGGLMLLLVGVARGAAVAGVAVLALGALTLSQYLFSVDIGIDQRIVGAPSMPATSHPGRMAPNTALGLMLTGLALALPALLGRGRVLLSILGSAGVIVFGLGLVALAGDAMRLESVYGWGALTRMAVQTAAALVVIGTALLLTAWYEGSRRDVPLLGWLPVPAGLGVFTILVLAWQASFDIGGGAAAPQGWSVHALLLLGALLAFVLAVALNRAHVAQVRWKAAESDRGALRAEIAERRGTEQRLRASESLVQMAANLARIGGWEVDLEDERAWWSDEVCRIHEMPPGTSIRVDEGIAFYAPEWRERIREVFTRAARDGIPYDEEMQIITASGKRRWVRAIGQPVHNPEGTIVRVQGAFQDITDRRKIEEALRRAAMVFEHTRDGVVVTDADVRILSVNRAFTEITGYTEDEVRGRNPSVLASGHHDSAFYRKLWEQLRELGHWQGEIRDRRKNGETYAEWLTIDSVRDDAGNVTHYVGVFTDISGIKESQERLEFLAHHDALTGLPNRVLLESRLAKALERAQRRGHRVALLYIDLDRFKAINDGLGHPVGDELLRQVPDRLHPRLRREDTLGRAGGDEFMLLLEHMDRADEAARVARDVLALLQAPFTLPSGHEVFIGASIGISLFPDDGASSSELVRNADSAMYRAKELGRNTFHFYTEELTRAAGRRLAMETRLRRAIEHREFVLYFQPQVSVADGRTIGVEALVRWNDKEKGLVGPDEFIPVAEESGLIAPLGLWVLKEACRQLQVWRHRGLALPQVAVNFSSQQFLLQDVTARVSEALELSGLPPEFLELEITESLLMRQGDSAPAMLRSLKDLGVRLVIDDFGIGYSSLAYLREFPIDRLKIDQSFVRDIETDHSAREIASTVVAMGHNLSLEVLAEGVENVRQLEILKMLECDAYQGFFASAPLPAEDLPGWLAAWPSPSGRSNT